MEQQMSNITSIFADQARIGVVVGFKMEMIMEAHPRATFVYNELFDQTNTSKSLLRALRASCDGGVLWMNGDVVFDAKVLERVKPIIEKDQSFICVNTSKVAEEEVKYIPLQAKNGDLAVYMRKQAIAIQFNDQQYVIVPQHAILMLYRDDGLFDAWWYLHIILYIILLNFLIYALHEKYY